MITELTTRMKIRASGQAIYEAFCDPQQLKAFWFTFSSDHWESHQTVQLGYAEFAVPPFPIHLQDCVPGESIRFLWGDEAGADRLVTITMEPLRTGDTLCSVRESGYRDEPSSTPHLINSKEGWTFMLTCLKAYLENGVDSLKLGLFIDDPDWSAADEPSMSPGEPR